MNSSDSVFPSKQKHARVVVTLNMFVMFALAEALARHAEERRHKETLLRHGFLSMLLRLISGN